MHISNYELKFSIASRTLFYRNLKVVHWDAYGKADTSNFQAKIPKNHSLDQIDGYLLHSVEITDGMNAASPEPKYIHYVLQEYPRYVTRLTGTFDDFLKTKSSKTRSTLRRKVRKFAQADDAKTPQWRKFSTPSEITEFLEQASPLASRTYQAKLFEGALPDTEEFRRESIELADKQQLLAYILYLRGKPVAYLYTPLKDRTLVYDYLGYDDKAANLSPGTVLQYLVHEELFKEKTADYFDFTEGDGAHKALFSTHSTQCCNILFLNSTLQNRFIVGCHRAWNKAVELSKPAAGRFKLKTKIKEVLR